MLFSFCLAALPSVAQQGGDLQAQVLYAFQTEDTNALASLTQTLRTQLRAGGAEDTLRYHLAHADYRMGLLLTEIRAADAAAAFRECVDELKPLARRDADAVEYLGLQSACYANLAGFEKIQGVLLRSRAADRLDTALRLAPRNPRIVYLKAVDGLAHSAPGSAQYAQSLEQLRLAALLFEQESATGVEAPGWGHAEAYLELGRQLMRAADVVGARNWIEKSLIAAPDYKAAQRQLALLVKR